MAFATAGTSTIFASITFHAAPNAADPAAVIRSTTCDGGSDGGMTGSGGATGGACATESEEIITGIAASAAQAARLLRYFRRIFSSRLIVNFDFILEHDPRSCRLFGSDHAAEQYLVRNRDAM